MLSRKVGIVGCGNMGEILLRGLVEGKIVDKKSIIVSEKRKERLSCLETQYSQVSFRSDNLYLVRNSQVILVAVKPQDMEILLGEIAPYLRTSHLIISIAAGIRLSFIEKKVSKTVPIIRVMPNLPALIGEGISAYCVSEAVSDGDEKVVKEIFGSIGKVLKLQEEVMDAVTALSGSGPAYLFYMLEGMIEAGKELGLGVEESRFLSLQTILGSARMVEKGEDPALLREKVTSPRGTTEAALRVLMRKKWKEILIQAIKKAEQRSKELSK